MKNTWTFFSILAVLVAVLCLVLVFMPVREYEAMSDGPLEVSIKSRRSDRQLHVMVPACQVHHHRQTKDAVAFGGHWDLSVDPARYLCPKLRVAAGDLIIRAFKKAPADEYMANSGLQLIEETAEYKKYYEKASNSIVHIFIGFDGRNVYATYIDRIVDPKADPSFRIVRFYRTLDDDFEIVPVATNIPVDFGSLKQSDARILDYVKTLILEK